MIACGRLVPGNTLMRITFDPNKRDAILDSRALDIADAGRVFDGFHLTRRDDAHSEDEERFVSVGQLHEEIVILIWTEREDSRRIVTMWKASEKERKIYVRHRDRPG
jgi:uncharacterized DUF497 family protein